jgi:hypothetical protein
MLSGAPLLLATRVARLRLGMVAFADRGGGAIGGQLPRGVDHRAEVANERGHVTSSVKPMATLASPATVLRI